MSEERENLADIWASLAAQCESFRLAYRTAADATVLGSLAGGLRATVSRLDTWREQQSVR